MSRRVVVFGDVIDDIVVVPSGPIRVDTDTPSAIQHRAGGSAANTASWLAHLGTAVDFVGRVGADDVERHAGILRSFGVTPHLAADHEHPTGTIVVLVDGPRRSMLTERGANSWLSADAVTDELLGAAALIHFTGYSIFHSPDPAAIQGLVARATERGIVVSVDPASAGDLRDFGVERFLSLLDGTTILLPNLEEGQTITGLSEPTDVASALLGRFPIVVLTLGDGGVVVAERGLPVELLSAIPVESVDPTGAGDAFSAGFLASWLVDGQAREAATAGCRAAARAVGRVGARPN